MCTCYTLHFSLSPLGSSVLHPLATILPGASSVLPAEGHTWMMAPAPHPHRLSRWLVVLGHQRGKSSGDPSSDEQGLPSFQRHLWGVSGALLSCCRAGTGKAHQSEWAKEGVTAGDTSCWERSGQSAGALGSAEARGREKGRWCVCPGV